MRNAYNNSTYFRPALRAMLLVSLFIGPLAGFAMAAASEQGRDLKGAGFVLYVSIIR